MTWVTLAAVGAGAAGASAQVEAHPAHTPAAAFAGAGPGTARQPVSAPMTGVHLRQGAWSVMFTGELSVNARRDPEPRGDASTFVTSMVGVSGRRALRRGWLELRAMASAEPAMGARGYPLLLQTGETADGVNPLVDRQHPHDAVMELSASLRFEIDRGAWAFVYLAPVGAPAVGPVPFMHRASAGDNPVAPITHHYLDATHISYGVVTAGLHVDERVQVELSFFNAREPDQERWAPERPTLNSWAGRVTVTPGRSWAVQGSFASLDEPEQLHPAIDAYRMTLSATHYRAFARGWWSTTLALGRNVRREKTMTLGEARARLPAPLLAHYLAVGSLPPGADDSLLLLFERRDNSAALLESAARWRGTTAFVRAEKARKDELFPATDLRHSQFFDVGKWEVGVVQDVTIGGGPEIGIGATTSAYSVAEELRSVYDDGARSYMLFGRIRL